MMYEDICTEKVKSLSRPQRIAWLIIDELYDRSGFDDWWDDVDEETQEEIFEKMQSIVVENP